MSLYGLFKGTGPSGFGYNSTAERVTEGRDLSGQTFLVTGANSGLGNETLRVLCERGATVLAAARTAEKAERTAADAPGDARPLVCELSEPASVHAAVATVIEQGHALDGVIANAGIMALPERTVKHGYELQFLTNHIGHFILVTGLLGQLTPTGRVVILSSEAHRNPYGEGIRLDDLDASGGYTAWNAYGQSKLSNLLFARELAHRLPEGQTANAVHPGVIATNLLRHMHPVIQKLANTVGNWLALKTVPQGAATQTWAATHPDLGETTGEYLVDCNVGKSSRFGRDMALARELWEASERIVAELPR